jgi:DNA-binding response OmpR family regulator/class 3 adenylate cyclase/predicted ATPase
MKRRVVLIVSKQDTIRAALARMMRRAGYAVELAEGAKRAREVTGNGRVDLAIVAPDGHCPAPADIVRELNDKADQLILLGGDEEETHRLAGLAPDTFILPANPLSEEELFAHIAQPPIPPSEDGAALADQELLSFAGRMLDVEGRNLRDAAERSVPLSPAEFALLLAFVRRPGRVLSREQLRGLVSGAELEPYERSIDMLVSRLRRKIEADRKRPRFIITVPGAGYKFAAQVERVTTRAGPVAAVPSPVPTPVPCGVAERRLVTTLSCTVIGLPRFASEHDPEEVQALTAALHEAWTVAIARFGGSVAGLLGDNLIAYFGYPEAHEDDAERAIRAGFELMEQVAGLASGFSAELHLSAGIATRPTIVGDLFTSGGRDFAAVGEAPWLARRLNSAAAPGAVIVGGNTRRLAGDAFHYWPLPPVQLDEVADPLQAWRVLGAAPVEGRFSARHGAGMTDFVGRGEEAGLLERRWWQARHGAGQVVVLVGEPGIGKSRLVVEFERRIAAQDYVPLRCFGSPYHTNSVLFPVIAQLERAAGFSRGDDAGAKLAKLRAFIAQSAAEPGEALPLIADLLSVHADDAVVPQCSPQRRKERTLTVLLAMMEQLAAQRPVLMIFEDVQWFDATTLELLALAVERVPRLPILLVATTRPEFALPWAEQAQVTVLQLSRLGPQDAALLVGEVAGNRSLDKEVARQIVERADGIPLFLEELTKMALEEGLKSAGAVPITLQGSLMQRLDQLGPAKAVAQIGSAIGRTFSDELLRLVETSAPSLDAALDRLVNSGLVLRRGAGADATYQFKHALVRDAAYASLSPRRRQALHARIAQALEEHFSEILDSQPELLAQHYAEAGNPASAVNYLIAAGERALLRSAGAEARAQIEAALQFLAILPQDDQRRRRELQADMLLHRVGMMTRGRTAPEVRQSLRHARELAAALDDQVLLPWIVFGQWYAAWSSADYPEAELHAQALAGWAEGHASSAAKTFAEYGLALCCLNTGSLREAREHFQAAHTLDDFDGLAGGLLAGYWTEGIVKVSSLLLRQLCLLLLGEIAGAREVADEATVRERAMSHPYARAIALVLTCRSHALRRDPPRTLETAAALIELASEQGYPDFLAHGMAYRGWALAMTGRFDDGIRLLQSGTERSRSLGYLTWHSQLLLLLSECHCRAGDAASALNTLSEAEQFIAETGERVLEAELHRLRAEVYFEIAGNTHDAEMSLGRALDTARQQGARLLELRTAASLSRLLANRGRAAEVRNVLAPVLDSFGEALDFAEFNEAKAIVEHLRQPSSLDPPGPKQPVTRLVLP